MTDLHNAIRDRLISAKKLLITSHVRPDGDAIGSLLALGLALLDINKEVQMVLTDGVPNAFRFLPGSERIRKTPVGEFDTIVTVDCSDLKRTGPSLINHQKPDIVIDHHVTNNSFGNLNLVEPDAVATASILLRHMPKWGLRITKDIAANLLIGLITDTLGFRTSNMTAEALRQAAELIEYGADLPKLYYEGLIRRSFSEALYWGAGLSSLKKSNGVIWGSLYAGDREAAGYTGNDDADLINVVSSIDESMITILFIEQNHHTVKVSWRASKPEVDVAQIAVQFGGGGHKAAAGAEIEGSMEVVQKRVINATKNALNKPGKEG